MVFISYKFYSNDSRCLGEDRTVQVEGGKNKEIVTLLLE